MTYEEYVLAERNTACSLQWQEERKLATQKKYPPIEEYLKEKKNES